MDKFKSINVCRLLAAIRRHQAAVRRQQVERHNPLLRLAKLRKAERKRQVDLINPLQAIRRQQAAQRRKLAPLHGLPASARLHNPLADPRIPILDASDFDDLED